MGDLDFYIDRPATDRLLNGLRAALKSPTDNPLIFHAYGIGGIGKTSLTKKIARDFADALVVSSDIGAELNTETPLKLMDKIYRQLPDLYGWREDFPEKYAQYQEARRSIEQDSQGKELIKATQSVAQLALKAAGEMVKYGSQAMLDAPGTIESFEKFLAGFSKTKGKTEERVALRNLLLDPFGVLTKSLVAALLARAAEKPLILIFDTYEQVGAEVDAWLLLYLLRENDFQSQRIRLVIMGRQKISSRSDNRYGWQKLEQDRGCMVEIEIPPFDFQQTTKYLQASGISDPQRIQRIFDITKGWPYYLKEVVKQEQSGNPNLAETEQKLSDFLLPFASDEQKRLVQIASCCRGFNKEILNTVWQSLEQTPVSAELHDWLERLSFIYKQSGLWRFDDVSRDVFRKVLFDDHRQLFEQVNQLLADYFYGQSNSYIATDAPIPEKYGNRDWLRERSSYLYHSFFVRQPNFLQFVTHLLEAHHFQCASLTAEVVVYINSEASLDRHPQLSSSCREFLTVIFPATIMGGWILENPEMVTEEFERRSLSEIWQYNSKLSGLSKFVGLYCQASHSDVNKARSLLQAAQQQAEVIKIDADPEFSSGLFLWEVGNGFSAIDSHEEAIGSYDRAISFKPDKHEAWYNRGISLGRLGRYEEAIKSYDRAISFKPNQHEAWYKRGNSLVNLGRYEEAIESYKRAISFKPDYHEAWYNRGNSLGDLGRYEEAIESYGRAISFKPDYHEAWYNRGISLGRLGRYKEAIESYDRAISFKPDKHEAWYNRGNSLDDLGRYEEAIESYDRAISFKPDKHEAWYGKGLVQFVTSDYAAALASWQQAFRYISDPAVPRYQEDISGLIQEFIEELIPRLDQPPIQQTLLIPLLAIYQESNVITELGAALVNTLHLIVAPALRQAQDSAISDHTAAQWLTLWQTSSLTPWNSPYASWPPP
jgi:tetratricopeptide (TPR) repeat protein